MKRTLLVLLMLATVILPSKISANDTLVIKSSEYPEGGGLQIPAADAVLLDTRGSIFSAAHGRSFGPPDTIALHYIGDDIKGYYSMPYVSGEAVVRIDAENLTPRGNPPFPGFEPGATAFLMVGREVPEGSLDMGVFADQWILNIRVER